ncbi:MAG: hypothetical protein E6J41_07035 [Chloroflexi bacterium]|nr:MAG: hypothetical protein E6J41_07035 [Chloroflexota bacterium]
MRRGQRAALPRADEPARPRPGAAASRPRAALDAVDPPGRAGALGGRRPAGLVVARGRARSAVVHGHAASRAAPARPRDGDVAPLRPGGPRRRPHRARESSRPGPVPPVDTPSVPDGAGHRLRPPPGDVPREQPAQPRQLVRQREDRQVGRDRRVRAKGERAVDPMELVLFSPAQYAAPGFPFVPFTRDLPVHWIAGRSLSLDRDVWLPASVVYFSYQLGPYAFEPRTNFPPYSGVAAGATWDAAVTSALEELIERDATMIWWLNAQPLPAVGLTPDLAAVWAGQPWDLGQRASLIYLDNEFDVPVITGVLENVREGLLALGFAARPDPAQAGLKAWAEALALQETTRAMDDPDSTFWTTAASMTPENRVKPHRPDRRYLDSFRPDFHDVISLTAQLQITLDPRAREAVRGCLDVETERPMSSLPHLTTRTSATYRERLERRGFEVLAVDLTTPDVAVTGTRVARVVVPGLVPNTPAAFLPLGRGRVQQAAVTLGWRDRPLEEEALNTFPLPHA